MSVVEVHHGDIVDQDAVEIGGLYAKAKRATVEALAYAVQCGQRLTAKKDSLPHGAWLPWLKANADVLGFESRVTSARLMKAANVSSTTHLSAENALAISRAIWGNDDDEEDGEAHVHVAANSGNNEWYTPAEYIEKAREVMGGIDLDPASSDYAQRTVKAKRFFTIDDNGLAKPWKGRVWMNPPYAQPEISQFSEKMVEEVCAGRVAQAITLTNNATETGWLQGMMKLASAACFVERRIRFFAPDKLAGAPLQGQVFLYFGKEAERFAEVFTEVGVVMVPAS